MQYSATNNDREDSGLKEGFSLTHTSEDTRRFLIDAFQSRGSISSLIPGFEERPQQQKMALLVWDSLAKGGHLLVEAGTGVGKSLAYLLPAAYWCLTNKKRIIVSTHTVNLQQQLVGKDIPMVAQILEDTQGRGTLNYALFKGRSHYLCLRKWNRVYEDTLKNLQLFEAKEEEKKLRRLSTIIDEGAWNGDREELPFHVADSTWSNLCSESDRCMSAKCPFRETCHYHKQRKYLESCHLIVVNHALFAAHLRLYQDTAGKTLLLPGHEAVIFDEAHHLEGVFRDSLTFDVGYNHLKRLSDDALRMASREPFSKLLPGGERERIESALQHLLDLLHKTLANLDPGVLYGGSKSSGRRQTRPYINFGRDKYRLREPQTIDESIVESLRNFSEVITAWTDFDLSDEERFEVNALARRFLAIAGKIENINTLEGDGDSFVYWSELEKRGRQRQVTLNSSPLEVGSYLRENLWSVLPSAILTSATLSTGSSFEYIKRLLEIDAAEAIVGSPFDYPNQACLCVPADNRGKEPNSPIFDDYVAEAVLQIADLVQGRSFILFTSKKALETVSQITRDRIEEKGYPVLVQGEMSREALLAEFKNRGNAVLMGLDSFWEGVDVPGEALSCVVLAKLPFPVPNDPVMQAREELWKAQGLNPFAHYSLPVTTLKLKQGFGRLIRSKTDRGAVVILDSRLITKAYGRTILRSLPPARFTTDLDDIAQAVPQPGGA
jgi:ATP-dependent DNA helicase DinG